METQFSSPTSSGLLQPLHSPASRAFKLAQHEARTRNDLTIQILICPGSRRAMVIPEYNEIDVDIIKNNMQTTGMTREEYPELLQRV